LLVNVPVPNDIIHNFEVSFMFIMDSLNKANIIARDVFARKHSGKYDLEKAQNLVARAKEYMTDENFRLLVDQKINSAIRRSTTDEHSNEAK